MSAQFDFNPGIDISGLSSVTQAQLLQMVAQLAPLDNIGGVIVMSGAASAHPDVTGNPRFARYLWIDTQSLPTTLLKMYDGSGDTYAAWVTTTIADSSITAAKLANYAVSILNGSGAAKIAYKQDGTADATKSNYLVRLDAAGQYVEIVPASTVVNGVTINLSQLNVSSATNGYVLTYNSSLGAAVWTALSVSALITAGSISYDKLLNGSALQAGYLMRANSVAPYDIQLVQNNDQVATLFPVRSIPVSKIYDSSYAAGRKLVGDGTGFVGSTPYYANQQTLNNATLAGNNNHGLGGMPNILIGYAVCNATDLGYAAGDKVALSSILTAGGVCACSVWADATKVYFSKFSDTGLEARPAAGGASSAITESKWDLYIYASL